MVLGHTVQAGTLVLAGANTTSGNTLVSGGTLQVANNLALQNSTFDTAGTGTLVFATGINTPTIGGLTGSGNLTLPSNITNLTLNPQATKTYSGVLGNTTPGMSVTKSGTYTQVLAGANTYSRNTILSAGTLQIGANSTGSVGAITSSPLGIGGLIFNGGSLSSDGTTPRTILNPVTFNNFASLGNATNTGKLTFSANSDLGISARTLTLNSDAQFDGMLTGSGGGITKSGTGILALSGNNTYTGGTSMVGPGTVILNASTAGWTTIPAANDSSQGLVVNDGTITMVGNPGQIAPTNMVTLNGGATLNLCGSNTLAGLVFNSNGDATTPTVTSYDTITAGSGFSGATFGNKTGTLTLTGDIVVSPTNVAVTPLLDITVDATGAQEQVVLVHLRTTFFAFQGLKIEYSLGSVLEFCPRRCV